MIRLVQLVSYLSELLEPNKFKDYCPNGLQVEGRDTIATLVTGVSATQALINAAIEKNADAILVHHGFFWKNENPTIVGMKYRRIKSLMTHDMSLLAYHLPLDAHDEFGNNIQLAKELQIAFSDTFEVEPGLNLGFIGSLRSSMSGNALSTHISRQLGRDPLHVAPAETRMIKKVAWCTGGAQDYIIPALSHDIDAFITGEASERTVHVAIENNIHFFAAGHHATERYGVKALGEHLSRKFDLTHYFIDIDNPV